MTTASRSYSQVLYISFDHAYFSILVYKDPPTPPPLLHNHLSVRM